MSSAPAAASPRPHIFALAWPLLVELILAVAIGVVGTSLAAHISDTAGAAFAIAHQISVTLFLLFRIVGSGVGVVITQSLGGGQRARADRVALASVGASTWIGALTALVAIAGAGPLLRLLQTPAGVYPLAVPFLMTLGAALLFDAWNASMAAVMRAHLRTRDTLIVLVAMHSTHVLLAIPLMHGWGPLPALGLPGFAVALTVSRALGLALHLVLWRRHLGLVMTAPDWWRLPRAELAEVLHIGIPAAAENIAWRLSFMAAMAAAGTLGAQALATHAYVQQVGNMVIVFSLSTAFAVEIMVGHMVGAGEFGAAHRLVRGALGRGLVISGTVSSLVALGGHWLLGAFTTDPAIIANGRTLLWIGVLIELGRTFNLVVINALRATGDVRFPVLAGAASMALVLAGGSWVLGIHFGLGLAGLYIAFAADEWIRGLIMWRRWAVQAWVPHARAARRKLRPRG
ncbi:putative MATE family efflux protein [Pseudoduganella flava]|uniref:MATE family efflux transporter n=1 Tax=Pseudoduganella flava TaxID=871742 RepID=A0A562PZK3_9BURK|nr:MATE family efflux transporter [Pseudoduganella flava]QGZ38571.1 MATE family efflux transporter [Pseudoduganella flava]TWI49865.1 putative MATE family efflux protein [Pseudoduganella flava]